MGWLTALAAAALLGCGGHDEELPQALTGRLDASCKANNQRSAAKILEVYDEPRVKRADSARKAVNLEAELFLPLLIANAEAQMRAIRSAAGGGEGSMKLKRILGAYENWIASAKRSPRRVVIANDIYNRARGLAGIYGLKSCKLSPLAISG